VAAVAAGLIAVALGQRPASWAPSSIWLTVIAASCGGAGLITFYMALERGKASLVLPLIGLYPVVVAILSVSFLGERIGAVQIAGIVLAVAGGVLLSAGG